MAVRLEAVAMNTRPPTESTADDLAAADLAKAAGRRLYVERFAMAWRDAAQANMARPSLNDFIREFKREGRRLVRELVAVEVDSRRRMGESPQPREYAEWVKPTDGLWKDRGDDSDPYFDEVRMLHEILPAQRAPAALPQSRQPSRSEPPTRKPRTERNKRTGSALPAAFGEYEVVEEIARGGMGIVYKARHKTLGREVALKTILSGELATPYQVQRFQLEAKAAASLLHPNIVPIFDIGQHVGQHYFSMGYVAGSSLYQQIKDHGHLSPRRAALLLAKAAVAIDFAHRRGVVHRDVKPQNILIDADDEPKIADFGLAKHLLADGTLTAIGDPVGTPGYMSPEQASGQSRVGATADVYGLGATLYHAVAGRPPLLRATPQETLAAIQSQDPMPPSHFVPAIPRELDLICLKCLSREPILRYASARALADDLFNFVRGAPIAARPANLFQRMVRARRRNPEAFRAKLCLATALPAMSALLCRMLFQ